MSNDQEGAGGRGASEQEPQASTQGPDDRSAAQETGALQSQVEEEKARAEKYLSNWQRAEADLANFKRRSEQDRADLVKFANASLIGRLLPILDDFERALNAIPAEQGSVGWAEGIKLIDRKLRNALEQEGVTTIDALGREFDPYVHEAVMREDGEGDVDVVVEEFQKGYKMHDRVLRPAMVKVGRRSAGSDKSQNIKEKE